MLEYIRNYGCRVLILSQTVFDLDSNICIENNFGEVDKINGK